MVPLPTWRHGLEHRQLDRPDSALRRALHRAGFVSGQASRRRALQEREAVIATRRRYLAAMRANRAAQGRTRRPEGSLDDTCGNVNHRQPLPWQVSGALGNVPAGVGERLSIVAAILQHEVAEPYGWGPKAHWHVQANRRTGDSHGSRNAENCSTWRREQLRPTIPSRSLLIFDHAPSHTLLTEHTFPQPHHQKAALHRWLMVHDIPSDAWLLQPALSARCRDHAPAPQ